MSAENFFGTTNKDREKQTSQWISEMQAPREKIEGIDLELPEEEEDPIREENDSSDNSDDTLNLNFTEDQLWSAKLALNKFDDMASWGLSIWTGKDPDRYRRRVKVSNRNDQDAQLLAALINKYQMKMSLEMAFVMAMLMSYSPVFATAYNDAKKAKKSEKPERQAVPVIRKNDSKGPI